MPPSNSPTDPRVADASASPFFELEALGRPVPDLASTLTTTQAEQDANDANVSFLRTPITEDDLTRNGALDDLPTLRRQVREEILRNRAAEGHDSESMRSMRQIQSALASNQRRYSPSELQELQDRASSALQRSNPGYHGWAPPADSGRSDPEHWSGLPTMSSSSSEFYDEQRRALLSTARQMQSYRGELQAAVNRDIRSGAGPSVTTAESSLRTAALLQSVRRNTAFSARSRSLLQNHISERERSNQESDFREPPSVSDLRTSDPRRRSGLGSRGGRHREQSPSTSMPSSLHDLARRDWILSGYQRQQEEELRRRQEGSNWHLEDAIKYLERLRFCDTYQESVSSAAAGGFVREEFFTTNHDDFILNTAMIDPPAESSWLRIGGIFSGSQHATNGSTSFLRNRPESGGGRPSDLPQLGQAQALPTNRHSFSYSLSNSTSQTPARHARSRVPLGTYENVDQSTRHSRTLPLNSAAERTLVQTSVMELPEERWPVKVKIHSIDYESMTLAGTMEAFNVPDKNSSTQVSSITTFLEGEIVDFNMHTLDTKTYRTDENTDSIYWRMLEPFKTLTDDEMVRGLVSKKWMREQLREKYILMRWKGVFKLLHTVLEAA
ncbi:MAG: hypothetical protein LQ346_001469 [Caloplaca aetnensis]|nr:MAG: hypothetical protein LQ346_001469 [Caloplaca aetnensis]